MVWIFFGGSQSQGRSDRRTIARAAGLMMGESKNKKNEPRFRDVASEPVL
jgi:hypothetical protein